MTAPEARATRGLAGPLTTVRAAQPIEAPAAPATPVREDRAIQAQADRSIPVRADQPMTGLVVRRMTAPAGRPIEVRAAPAMPVPAAPVTPVPVEAANRAQPCVSSAPLSRSAVVRLVRHSLERHMRSTDSVHPLPNSPATLAAAARSSLCVLAIVAIRV